MPDLEIDDNHRLRTDGPVSVGHWDSPNTTPGRRGAIRPSLCVVHWTGGPDFRPVMNTFMNPRGGVSAHLVIERDGTIHQFVPFSRKAWHAGRSSWNGRKSVNNWSIGVELVNSGLLIKENGKFFTRGRRTIEICPTEVSWFAGKPYQTYTEKQLASVRMVMEALEAEYGISEWVGHSDVSPGRKTDPGPLLLIDDLFAEAMTIEFVKVGDFILPWEGGFSSPEPKRKLNTIPDWLRSILSFWDPKEER